MKSPTQIWQEEQDKEFDKHFTVQGDTGYIHMAKEPYANPRNIQYFRQNNKALIEHVMSLGPEDKSKHCSCYNAANAEWREVLKKVLEELK